jgi:transcriptional regulator with XRE-family HTH domain
MSKGQTLSNQVRKAVNASGRSRYRVCQDLGIDQATLSRFMSGERGLTLKVLDRLTEYLGMTLRDRAGR